MKKKGIIPSVLYALSFALYIGTGKLHSLLSSWQKDYTKPNDLRIWLMKNADLLNSLFKNAKAIISLAILAYIIYIFILYRKKKPVHAPLLLIGIAISNIATLLIANGLNSRSLNSYALMAFTLLPIASYLLSYAAVHIFPKEKWRLWVIILAIPIVCCITYATFWMENIAPKMPALISAYVGRWVDFTSFTVCTWGIMIFTALFSRLIGYKNILLTVAAASVLSYFSISITADAINYSVIRLSLDLWYQLFQARPVIESGFDTFYIAVRSLWAWCSLRMFLSALAPVILYIARDLFVKLRSKPNKEV